MVHVILGHRCKRLFWLPGHIWIGRAVFAVSIALHQAVACHIEVVLRMFVVWIVREDKGEHESSVDASFVKYRKRIGNFPCL